jgi:AhpD family alkylhydroperoxidase
MKIEIFDPPMCCSTGVCGLAVNPDLVRFAANLDWLMRQGVEVERYTLSQQPAAFAGTQVVKESLAKDGNDCLPLTLVDGAVVCTGKYPTREMLAGYAGITARPSMFTDAVKELVAIGASIASNCEPCFKYHYNEARKVEVSKEDILLAVEIAQAVKESPARAVLDLAHQFLSEPRPKKSSCCGGDENTAPDSKCCG